MRLQDWIREMERIAPPELALDFDNPGLLTTPERKEIRRVLVALDCTTAVAREAAAFDADLVLTHHPLFFHGVKHILEEDPDTAAAYLLLRNGIGMYAAHTNLDAAEGGVNDALLACFALRDVRPLPGDGLGRIGTFDRPMTLRAFAALVQDKLQARADVAGDPEREILTVACVSGSGAEDIAIAKAAGADVFLTGECRHHEALAAKEIDMPLVVAGHYETEKIVLLPLIARLQALSNDVQYKVSQSDSGPYWRL